MAAILSKPIIIAGDLGTNSTNKKYKRVKNNLIKFLRAQEILHAQEK